jgi:hypothetical protein
MAGGHMDFEKEYSQRFDHRRDRNIFNLAQIADIAHQGGSATLKALPSLVTSLTSDEPADALRGSILMLWLQAVECYIFGQFEACILAAGAVVERCLKLEYLFAKGPLPAGTWTLGKCINNLDWSNTRITADHLKCAEAIRGPRNSRAHALLEHSDPQESILGGQRGINLHAGGHYTIEPYRGEASKVVANAWEVLASLYSGEINPSD